MYKFEISPSLNYISCILHADKVGELHLCMYRELSWRSGGPNEHSQLVQPPWVKRSSIRIIIATYMVIHVLCVVPVVK